MTDVLDPPIAAGEGAESPDAELVAMLARIATGDQDAFAELYDATSAAAFGLALRVTGDHALTVDVVDEVYLSIWRDAGMHSATRAPVMSWIRTLTRRCAVRRVRAARSAKPRASGDELGVAASLAVDVPGDSCVLSSAGELAVHTARLSLEQQIVVALAYFGGHSHAEIAERTGEPVGAVKARMREALTLLGTPPFTDPAPA